MSEHGLKTYNSDVVL